MLENGVSASVGAAPDLLPSAQGRFPQVSGLCFSYNVAAASGSRVTGAVRQAADGSCTGAAVDLTAGTTYTIAENDFMANGGDGYPNFSSRMTSQDIMEEVVADYITANTPIAPKVLGGADGSHHLSGRRHGDGPELPIQGGVSLTSQAPVPRVNDRAGAPRLMAAGRRLLSAVLLGLVTARPARGRGRDTTGSPGSRSNPLHVNPGGVVVIRGHQVATDDQVHGRRWSGPSGRIELATAVTDGEGHFTVGATIPPETAVGRYTIEVTGLSGVHMTVDLLSRRNAHLRRPEWSAPGARRRAACEAVGRNAGSPDQGASQTRRRPGARDRSRAAGGPRACGRRVRPVHALEPTTNQAQDRFDRLALASGGDPRARRRPSSDCPTGRASTCMKDARGDVAVRRQGAEPAQPRAAATGRSRRRRGEVHRIRSVIDRVADVEVHR